MLHGKTFHKIRLLQVIPSLDIGGAQKFLVDLVKAINKEKFLVWVCVLGKREGTFLEKELAIKGIPTFFLNVRWAFHPLSIRRFVNLFNIFKPDVLHTHLRAIRYVLLPSRLTKVPLHIHTIHSLAKQDTSFFYRWLNRIAFKRLDVKPVSISKEVARTVREVYGTESVVIYNGVPTMEYSLEKGKSENSEILLINVGKFKKAKNHLVLVEAFAKAVEKERCLRLSLVGDGSLRRKVEERVKKLGLHEKVTFLGWRNDVPKLLRDCDIFVLSSDWEGFGIVVVEAMAAGKPIVATRVGGIPEVVEDGITGLLVPPRDADTLAEAILRLAKNEKLRKEMGESGRQKAVNEFDICSTAKLYEKLYESYLYDINN